MTSKDRLPCKSCKTSAWYKTGKCKECQRISQRKWDRNNREKLHEIKRQWHKNNPDKQKEYTQRWRSKNRELVRELSRKWKKDNPEKVKIYKHNYYVRNKEKIYQYKIKWNEDNKERRAKKRRQWANGNRDILNALRQKRRAKKAKNGGSYTPDEWSSLCKKYDNKCLCCKKSKKLTADHIIPISKGGSSNISNIQPLCRSCNCRKKDRTIDYR